MKDYGETVIRKELNQEKSNFEKELKKEMR